MLPLGCSQSVCSLRGIGMGATLMPAMAAAYTVLAPEAVPRAASALEIVQRAGALFGIALLAVILQSQLPLSLSELDTAPAATAADAAAAHVRLGAGR